MPGDAAAVREMQAKVTMMEHPLSGIFPEPGPMPIMQACTLAAWWFCIVIVDLG